MKEQWLNREAICEIVLKSSTVNFVSSKVEVEEKDPGGAGVVAIELIGDAIQFGPKETGINWLKSAECADGAFISWDDNGIHLHIVELKSKLDTKKWLKAKSQFKGMFLRAKAVCGVLGFTPFASVTCYIAYCEDALSDFLKSNPIMLKRTLGTALDLSGTDEWSTLLLSLDDLHSAKVVKILRDEKGHGAISLV